MGTSSKNRVEGLDLPLATGYTVTEAIGEEDGGVFLLWLLPRYAFTVFHQVFRSLPKDNLGEM